jgi:2-oxoglutarate ferredoxin oxidoreductase subunit beta
VTYDTHGVVPLGVFRDIERDSYDALVAAQLANANGPGDLQTLVASGDTWAIS